MQLELLNAQGLAASKVDAPETVFGRDYNESLIHQIVVAFQANARQGTRAQKDREQVKHSTKKPFKQKGTGRVFPGKRMTGHMGDVTKSIQNLDVIRIDEARQLLLIKGAIPGSKGGFVTVRHAVKAKPEAKGAK